jgi:threonine synthase
VSPLESCLHEFRCARCDAAADPDRLQTFCTCGGTWLAGYDLERAARTLDRPAFAAREPGLWAHPEMMPVRDPARRRGLGEGGTPLLRARRVRPELNLRFKDEGWNPGGSFKARGMAAAVARAAELGARALALPSAGNAGAAAAAYGALWNLPVHVALPAETPEPFRAEIAAHGARCYDVDGDIARAGAWLADHDEAPGWFFLSTLKEPYRVEGKKTMGYELVRQLGGRWPRTVVYPTGGGTGIVGMDKADRELRALGLVEGPPPQFVIVQAEGCAPLVRAYEEGLDHAPRWENPVTAAAGLRVPGTIGDHLILDAVRRTGGTALTVTEAEIRDAQVRLGREEGIYAAPEAAATLAAADRLLESGWLAPGAEVVLLLTGNGFKYPAPEPA